MKLFWPRDSFEVSFEALKTQAPLQPFNKTILDFTQSLSKRLLSMRHMPEVVALGYWLRKANINKMQQDFERRNVDKLIRARGLVFHVAPSNVDTIFVYSWLLSLLAGNKNIIRLSSKAEVNELLQIVLAELPKHEEIAKRTIICTYGHNDRVSSLFSEACQTRVIWGGDSTIQSIRQIPLAPLSNELAFADRFSLAILQSNKVADLDEKGIDVLLEQFYNDVFWFDQMACSSPRLVIWEGEPVARFWELFELKVKQKQYELLAATQVLKYTTSLQLATEKYVEKVEPTTYFSRVELQDVPATVREQHCGGGLFYEYAVKNIIDVSEIIQDKDQTIAYYGFEKQQLLELVEAIPTRGIDRIVPIGKALDFNGVWDGQDFLTSFTREVNIL